MFTKTQHLSMLQKTSHPHRGFTLIELLVVISIIALLIALLLPALKAARDSARAVVCQSNMHQFSLVYQMYQDDSLGYNPTFRWQTLLEPYVTSTDFALCPNAPENNTDDNPIEMSYLMPGIYWANSSNDPRKYFINGNSGTDPTSGVKYRDMAVNREEVESPHWTAVLSEYWVQGNASWSNKWGDNWLNDRRMRSMHPNTTSYLLMADAHVDVAVTDVPLYANVQMVNAGPIRNDYLFHAFDGREPTVLQQ